VPALNDAAVDEEIATDWKDILERHTPEEIEQPEKPVKETAAKPEVAAEPAAKPDAPEVPVKTEADRARDKVGRYKPETKAAKQDRIAAKPEEKPEADAAAAEQPQQPAAQARDLTRAPSTWRPTARADWTKLPESTRAEIHKREADFLAGQSQLLPDARFGSSMTKAIEPYRMLIESEGVTPEVAFAELLRSVAVLRTGTPEQKYGTLANIAQRYGLDLRMFSPQGQQQNGQAQQQFRDPRVDQLIQQFQTRETQQAQEAQQRAALETQQTTSFVDRWMNEVDAAGTPKRPYVGDVINEMSALIPQLKDADPTLTHTQALEAAYERATWAHPEIRVLLQQQQQTELDAKRRTDSQARVRDARRASSVNVPRRSSIPAPAKPGSLEETIAATARELGLISS
jgi:hypothetical protein